MKKIITLFFACTVGFYTAKAAPVPVSAAKTAATNFFNSVSQVPVAQLNLAYTEADASGNALYYVFNVNTSDGFVIITADDALHPIIGYSTEKRAYTIPAKGTNIDFWMQKRKAEIIVNRTNKVTATPDITNEWSAYINNTVSQNSNNTKRAMGASQFPSSTAYLVKSTYDQESPYYDDCPGTGSNKSVTGCVATTMVQIMRYWQYPATGQSSSSYNGGGSIGTLSAKYTHGYGWSTMPLTAPNTSDTNLARAMSDAGISVDMSYSPTGSGAYVITSDNPGSCAQISYVKYFKYSPTILSGEYQYNNATAWADTLEHELDRSRPIQYVGTDPSQGGHTWVCDGYDANNNFHMNWGWSGANDGWYALNNLNPNTLNFSQNLEALMGIMPPAVTNAPAAAFTESSKQICTNGTVQFIDMSSNQPTSWSWTFPGANPATSTAQNPVVTYTATGTYAVTLSATNSIGTNSVTTSSVVNVVAAPPVPVITQSNDTLYCTPGSGYTYEWYKSGVLISGATSGYLVITVKGVYICKIINSAGCNASTTKVVTSIVSGINEISSLSDYVTVYPNPTNGKVQVVFDLPTNGDYKVAISNILGQPVYANTIHVAGQFTQNLDLSGFSKGMYFLSIEGGNSKGVKKIVLY